MLIMQSYIRAVLILKCHKKAENVQVVGRQQIAGLHRSLHRRYQVSAASNEGYIRRFFFFCKSNFERGSCCFEFNS